MDLLHLRDLLLFKFLVLEELLTLLQNILPHRHCLFEVLVAVLKDLFEGLLVHSDHFLLIIEHFAGLIRLCRHPVRLSLHLLVLHGG